MASPACRLSVFSATWPALSSAVPTRSSEIRAIAVTGAMSLGAAEPGRSVSLTDGVVLSMFRSARFGSFEQPARSTAVSAAPRASEEVFSMIVVSLKGAH